VNGDFLATRVEVLGAVEFFRDLAPSILQGLASSMEVVRLAAGQPLMQQGGTGSALYVVTSGRLRAEISTFDGTTTAVGNLGPGDLVGEMQLMVGGARSASVLAEEPCELLELSRANFDALAFETPSIVDQLAMLVSTRLRLAQLASILPALLGDADDAFFEDLRDHLEWVSLPRGAELFRRGDPGDAWYVVTSGRLAVLSTDSNGQDRVKAEIGSGEGVGEMAILSERSRTATVVALRDTQLMRLPRQAFDELLPKWPHVLLSISRALVDRLASSTAEEFAASKGRHVAVVALDSSVNLDGFCRDLSRSMSTAGEALHLTSQLLESSGVLADAESAHAEHPQWTRFAAWFEQQQREHDHVVLQADSTFSSWTSRAVRESDHVLLVADARCSSQLRSIEIEHLNSFLGTLPGLTVSLVLLHDESTVMPRGTRAWLDCRDVGTHHHLRIGRDDDLARLGRVLTGRAIGLALGGGGARGAAHFGVVRALNEAGVPIDMVSGTSAGSIAAGMFAMGLGYDEMLERTERSMGIKPFAEFTLPFFSVIKGTRVDESARIVFGDTQIEDLWIPYFAISSNLTTAQMMVHDDGPLWFATRASGSLPGIVPPVTMGDDLLVDGGVIDNLPCLTLRERGGGSIIAVNVSPEDEMPRPPGGFPSPWQMVSGKLFGGSTVAGVPNILSILMRTSWLASAGRLHSVRRKVEVLLEPPIDRWGMLEFEASREIAAAGYEYAVEELKKIDFSSWR
jgi:predicted acylesterase/phospholipase RssA/CRP-like cAMP-binding protein